MSDPKKHAFIQQFGNFLKYHSFWPKAWPPKVYTSYTSRRGSISSRAMPWQPDTELTRLLLLPKASPWSRLHPRAPANEPALGNWFSCAPRYHHLSTEMKTGLVPWGQCSVRPLKVISFFLWLQIQINYTQITRRNRTQSVLFFFRRSSCQRSLTAQTVDARICVNRGFVFF